MDQIDNHSNIISARQHINYDLPYCENHDDITQSSSIENEQISMSMVYKKRIRTKFTQEQLDVLESIFQQHRHPSVEIIDDLVEQLNLSTQKITVWFQNRRARLKKSQGKSNDQHSGEKDDQQHYDSGIHLDEDVSRDSSVSPSSNALFHLPPPSSFMTAPSPHYPFYNPIWPNFHYQLPTSSFQSTMNSGAHIPYNSSEIPSPFIFQDMSNYYHQRQFNGDL